MTDGSGATMENAITGEEMTPAEEEWFVWANLQAGVDTGGYCDCGHQGLGVAWHLDTCRGASYALRNKVMELMVRAGALDTSLQIALRELAALSARVTGGVRDHHPHH